MTDPNARLPATVPALTGEALARAVAADFESFFLPWQPMKVRIAVEPARSPCIRGVGDDARIVITPDMASDVIRDSDTFFFHLLILGHEIAHLVHRHLNAKDVGSADDRALEFWADFYGAKVLMVLVTYGDRCSAIFRSYFGAAGFETPLESVGRAVGRMVESGIYNEHPRYPKPLLRVGLVSNGITSFLRLNMESPPPIWYFSVFKRIFGTPSVRELMLLHPEHVELDFDPIRRAQKWHRSMQGDDIAITRGFKLNLARYLHTTFDQTVEERRASHHVRLAELQAAGFLLDVSPDELWSEDE
ncbi:MAG TPA: hypothetical protein VF718_12955 [Allosphingosinicella sp.]|jgi:hypothetical protein